MANAVNARRQRGQNFWARKLEAFQTYGRALSRPQDNFRNYMISKRRINFGYDHRTMLNQANITGFGLTRLTLPITPPNFNLEAVQLQNLQFFWVYNEASFAAMIADIRGQNEIALDIECNEHSFFGMCALLQISTYNRNYLVDPFVLFESIQTTLKPILENPQCIKVMHGCCNDAISLSRDFAISLAGVVDTQHIHQQLIRVAIGHINNGLAQNVWPNDFQSILWRSTRNQAGRQKSNQELLLETTQLISLTNLVSLYIPNQVLPNPNAQLSDWRIRPIANLNMQRYAVCDSFLLLKIWSKMKIIIRAQQNGDGILQRALASTLPLINRHFVRPTEQTADDAIQQVRVAVPLQPLFRIIYAWRQNYSKMTDEAANEILTLQEILSIVATQATTQPQIREIVGRRIIPCESIDNWVLLVANLGAQGEAYWNHLQNIKCHCCFSNGRNRYGHAHCAWGCGEAYSTAGTRDFFNDPSNADLRARRDENRLRRWNNNHPNLPLPDGGRNARRN